MDAINEAVSVNGWQLTRQSATAVDGSTRFKAAEALARFAEAEKFRAAAMLHDEAQEAIDPRLEALQNRPGMRISLRTGRIVSSAATDSAAMEIALIAGLSPGQGHRVLDQAETLVMDTPEVLESLALGRIGASHVQRILEHTHHITADPPALPARDADEARKEEFERDVAAAAARARADRRDFGADMLAIAAGKSPTQLRARGRQVLEKYYGFSFTKRSRTELRDRRIELEQARDGMTWFSGYLPTASCQAIFAKVDAMARLLKTDPETAAAVSQAAAHAAGNTGRSDEPAGQRAERSGGGAADPAPGAGAGDDAGQFRTLDQLRADVFTDMMLNGPRGQGLETVDAQVFVTIPATMLPGTEGGPTGI
ncbi:MAG: 13E12 repeat family protein, partial [Micrococcaceae bacterium]|nr:13E12 repeat family protein [Micrococcaceae bacterium]